MNKSHLLLVALAFSALVSCDKVEPPYLEGNTQGISYIGTSAAIIFGDTLAFTPTVDVPVKKVLVEDYTGHTCGNCPAAGIYLSQTLQPLYPEQVIAISVHAGTFAAPTSSLPNQPANSFQTDFRTPVGDAWNTKFSVSFNPCGMVDRIGYPTSRHLLLYPSWRSAVDDQRVLTPELRLRIKTSFDAASGEAHVAVQSENLVALAEDLRLQVVLTEDSVIDWQEWYNHTPEYEPSYLHRHVLRTSLNSDFGETIYSGTVPVNSQAIRGYALNLAPGWNPEHCHVVAFLYNVNTEAILQVEEAALAE